MEGSSAKVIYTNDVLSAAGLFLEEGVGDFFGL